MMSKYDAIIIGGGHNGLVCANYLALGGLKKIKVLERRNIVGGAAVTEEFYPGFKNSVASYTVSLLNPKIIQDLKLHENGLKIIERKVNNVWPHPDGDFLAFTVGASLKQEIARFSEKDSLSLEKYFRDVGLVADLIRDFLLKTPPNAGGGIRDIVSAAILGNRVRKLSIEDERLVLDIFTKSVSDYLDFYFENKFVKGAFAFDGVVGNFSSPHAQGSAYVLMHHAFGEVNGKKGVWGHAVGGMGSITQAMAKNAKKLGVDIEIEAPVTKVITKAKKAVGVLLENGEELYSDIVVSNLNPQLLFCNLIDKDDLPHDFLRRMERYKNASGTFRMNVALDTLPEFSFMKKQARATQEHLTGGIVIGPTIDYLDKAYIDAVSCGWSNKPIVEMLIPSLMDDSLAPPGKHVASLFCQQFSPDVDWNENREAAANVILDTVEEYAPGFKNTVLGTQILSPLDLEKKFGLIGGDIMHGVLSLDQMFSSRPVLGHGNYRAPLQGLYMCGAGTHPGGGVTGAPGHNCAKEILRDQKWGRKKVA